jgi:hypothetical protein
LVVENISVVGFVVVVVDVVVGGFGFGWIHHFGLVF